ncbi:MAG: hypothetical protein ACYS18_11540 [Planctomycetota bacterium]|jgi:hypothetical protein
MKRKDLSEKKWAVLEDLFYSELDENAVLKKHNVSRTTYERWLRQKLFSRQFQQYTASLARRTALAVAKAETEVAARLVELTRCQKEESARKACQHVLAIANRFFEAVARINEGPLGDNRGDFGGKRGKNGGNRGIFEQNRGIYGFNQDTSDANLVYSDHNHHDPVITPEQASKILAVLAENEDKK